MSEYTELMNALNTADKRPCSDLECPGSKDCSAIGCLFREAADELNRLRNELCLRCGAYHNAHLGACDGCRWRKVDIACAPTIIPASGGDAE